MTASPLPRAPAAVTASAASTDLDTIRLSHHQRLRARARMEQAELMADWLVRTWRAIAR